MKAVVCERWGDPEQVLQVREVPTPEPGPGQVRVRMLASPVNPSDLLMVRGEYGRLPPLPVTPGFEGVGVVEAGSGLLARLRMGKRVAVLGSVTGNWAEHTLVSARQAVPIPADVSDEQAASFFVNPATALVMTRYVLRVPRGAWLLQTAAGSALGRMIIRLAKRDGFKTINAIRRREQADELRRLGADAVVVTTEEPLAERVKSLTGGEGASCALDAVGGTTGAAAVESLGRGGRMLVYGTLAGEPIPLNPRALMVGQKSVAGFWLSEWVRDQNVVTMLLLFRRIGRLIADGTLATEGGPTFPLDDVCSAVREAARPGRQGKVLLRIGTK